MTFVSLAKTKDTPNEKETPEKLFCNLVYVASIDAHALGKDVADNAMEKLWPQALDIHPSTSINSIKAAAGEGSCVNSLPEVGLREHAHCGAGTCVPQRRMEVPPLHVCRGLGCGNVRSVAQEHVSRKAGGGSTVASLPKFGLRENAHRGLGTCARQSTKE